MHTGLTWGFLGQLAYAAGAAWTTADGSVRSATKNAVGSSGELSAGTYSRVPEGRRLIRTELAIKPAKGRQRDRQAQSDANGRRWANQYPLSRQEGRHGENGESAVTPWSWKDVVGYTESRRTRRFRPHPTREAIDIVMNGMEDQNRRTEEPSFMRTHQHLHEDQFEKTRAQREDVDIPQSGRQGNIHGSRGQHRQTEDSSFTRVDWHGDGDQLVGPRTPRQDVHVPMRHRQDEIHEPQGQHMRAEEPTLVRTDRRHAEDQLPGPGSYRSDPDIQQLRSREYVSDLQSQHSHTKEPAYVRADEEDQPSWTGENNVLPLREQRYAQEGGHGFAPPEWQQSHGQSRRKFSHGEQVDIPAVREQIEDANQAWHPYQHPEYLGPVEQPWRHHVLQSEHGIWTSDREDDDDHSWVEHVERDDEAGILPLHRQSPMPWEQSHQNRQREAARIQPQVRQVHAQRPWNQEYQQGEPGISTQNPTYDHAESWGWGGQKEEIGNSPVSQQIDAAGQLRHQQDQEGDDHVPRPDEQDDVVSPVRQETDNSGQSWSPCGQAEDVGISRWSSQGGSEQPWDRQVQRHDVIPLYNTPPSRNQGDYEQPPSQYDHGHAVSHRYQVSPPYVIPIPHHPDEYEQPSSQDDQRRAVRHRNEVMSPYTDPPLNHQDYDGQPPSQYDQRYAASPQINQYADENSGQSSAHYQKQVASVPSQQEEDEVTQPYLILPIHYQNDHYQPRSQDHEVYISSLPRDQRNDVDSSQWGQNELKQDSGVHGQRRTDELIPPYTIPPLHTQDDSEQLSIRPELRHTAMSPTSNQPNDDDSGQWGDHEQKQDTGVPGQQRGDEVIPAYTSPSIQHQGDYEQLPSRYDQQHLAASGPLVRHYDQDSSRWRQREKKQDTRVPGQQRGDEVIPPYTIPPLFNQDATDPPYTIPPSDNQDASGQPSSTAARAPLTWQDDDGGQWQRHDQKQEADTSGGKRLLPAAATISPQPSQYASDEPVNSRGHIEEVGTSPPDGQNGKSEQTSAPRQQESSGDPLGGHFQKIQSTSSPSETQSKRSPSLGRFHEEERPQSQPPLHEGDAYDSAFKAEHNNSKFIVDHSSKALSVQDAEQQLHLDVASDKTTTHRAQDEIKQALQPPWAEALNSSAAGNNPLGSSTWTTSIIPPEQQAIPTQPGLQSSPQNETALSRMGDPHPAQYFSDGSAPLEDSSQEHNIGDRRALHADLKTASVNAATDQTQDPQREVSDVADSTPAPIADRLLYIGVFSGAGDFERRKTARKTWIEAVRKVYASSTVRINFVIGRRPAKIKAMSETVPSNTTALVASMNTGSPDFGAAQEEVKLDMRLGDESNKHGDLYHVPYEELPVKVLVFFAHAVELGYRFVMKVDTAHEVLVQPLITSLIKESLGKFLYAGQNFGEPSLLSIEEEEEGALKKYFSGPCYLASWSLARRISKQHLDHSIMLWSYNVEGTEMDDMDMGQWVAYEDRLLFHSTGKNEEEQLSFLARFGEDERHGEDSQNRLATRARVEYRVVDMCKPFESRAPEDLREVGDRASNASHNSK